MLSANAFYLLLPMMLLEIGLIVYTLGQDKRATTNRLFALYMASVLVTEGTSLIRATTVSETLVFVNTLFLAPLLSLNTLFLTMLTMALFIPHRFAQPWVRWLIALPYLVGFGAVLLDLILGWGVWFAGLTQLPAGTWRLDIKASFNPLLIGLIVASVVPIIITAAVAVRHPDRRVAALTIFAGSLISFLILSSPQSRGIPVIYNLAPLPTYLAFAWATLRSSCFDLPRSRCRRRWTACPMA